MRRSVGSCMRDPGRRRHGCRVLLAAWLAAAMAAQEPGKPGAPKSVHLDDPSTDVAELATADAQAVDLAMGDRGLQVTVTMKVALATSVFTCVHVFIDTTADQKDGVHGDEIWARAAIGSRYHATNYQPTTAGAAIPAELIRASASLPREVRTGEQSRVGWIHSEILARPVIGDKTIAFTVPRALLDRMRGRYAHSMFVKVVVETGCSEQPILLEHVCSDRGLPISLDGSDVEWSARDEARDPSGELHPDFGSIDITRMRVEHSLERLFLFVNFAAPGLGQWRERAADIDVRDTLSVFVLPMAPSYQPEDLFLVNGTNQKGSSGLRNGTLYDTVHQGNGVEIAIDRKKGQNRFRIEAWSDAIRRDMIPNEGRTEVGW